MHQTRRVIACFVLLITVCLPGLALGQVATPRLLIDMHTGEVLYEENAGNPWHPASLTKLMTALLAFEAIETGRVTLDSPVVSSASALAAPPSRMGFPVGTAITLEDALYILIVKSANDIAVAVAETIGGDEATFVAMMNQRAAQLGLTGTHFVNPHGLHDPAQVTTARDMALIGMNIRLRYPQYDALFETHAIEHAGTRMPSNNELLSGFAGTDGMKTGYICSSGLNIVATAERGGRTLMAVVFGGASSRDRGEATGQMMLSGFAGGYRGYGRTVMDIANRMEVAPVDMRPLICGEQAPTYAEARAAAFPAGLDGQVSYLLDSLSGATHRISTLAQWVDVPLPRARPAWLAVTIADSSAPSLANPMGDGDNLAPTALNPAMMAPQSALAPVPLPRPAGL